MAEPLPAYADWLAAAERLGLRREGRELSGPCPACGGDDRFHVSPAVDGRGAKVGCRGCIDGQGDDARRKAFGDVLRAAGYRENGSAKPPARAAPKVGNRQPAKVDDPQPARARDSASWAARCWLAASPVAEGDPAWRYFVHRRLCWPPDLALPENARWLPLGDWPDSGPRPDAGFAGAALFRIADAAGRGRAVHFEALGADGARGEGGRRWRRTFGEAQGASFAVPGPAQPPAIVEGCIDALAARWLRDRRALAFVGTAGMAAADVAEGLALPDHDRAGWAAADALRRRNARVRVDYSMRGDPADELARTMLLELAMHGGDLAAAWRFYRNENCWEADAWTG